MENPFDHRQILILCLHDLSRITQRLSLLIRELRLESRQHPCTEVALGRGSKRGDTEIDRAWSYVLRQSGHPFEIQEFSPFGYDERQYCSPGFNLPIGSFMRTPYGKFGTFNVLLKDRAASHAAFRFYAPRIFLGIDAYNDGDADATVTIRSAETSDSVVTLKPKELRRIRTLWSAPSSAVTFEFKNGQGLRFDNLAYLND